jgi:hypothetical protein
MKRKTDVPILCVLIAGMSIGVVTSKICVHSTPRLIAADQAASGRTSGANENHSLRTEIEQLKGKLPGQAHAMMDVTYHYGNLWFAAHQGNWPLAQFYFNETRSHLRWAVRIIPVRKDSQGREVKLADILESIENRPLKELEAAIKGEDREKFVAAYKFTLEGCYACHKATDKPYLTLKIPDQPPEAMVDFSPQSAPFPEKKPAR